MVIATTAATVATSAAVDSAKSSDGLLNQAFKVAVLVAILALVVLAIWTVTWVSGGGVQDFIQETVAGVIPAPIRVFAAGVVGIFTRIWQIGS